MGTEEVTGSPFCLENPGPSPSWGPPCTGEARKTETSRAWGEARSCQEEPRHALGRQQALSRGLPYPAPSVGPHFQATGKQSAEYLSAGKVFMDRHKTGNREESHRAEQPGPAPRQPSVAPWLGTRSGLPPPWAGPRAFRWGLCVLKPWSAATGRAEGHPRFCSGPVGTTGLLCPPATPQPRARDALPTLAPELGRSS